LSRTIRMLALTGALGALIVPASASGAPLVSPPTLDFGDVPVGTTSAPQPVALDDGCTIVVPGTPDTCGSFALDPLNVNLSPTGDFAVAGSDCPATIGPTGPLDTVGSGCSFSVSFTPTELGPRAGILSAGMLLTALPGPAVFLTGNGVAPSSAGPSPAATPTGTTLPHKKCRKKAKRHKRSAQTAKKCKKKKKKR
jgi:hypothetical protein